MEDVVGGMVHLIKSTKLLYDAPGQYLDGWLSTGR